MNKNSQEGPVLTFTRPAMLVPLLPRLSLDPSIIFSSRSQSASPNPSSFESEQVAASAPLLTSQVVTLVEAEEVEASGIESPQSPSTERSPLPATVPLQPRGPRPILSV